jgi:dihydrofolate reductase
MRKVIYAINITLDGICDHTKVTPDDELYDHYIRLLQEADVLVYGRKTYELMIPYWPDIAKSQSGDAKENEFARAFDAVGKIVVFSRSLAEAEGKKTRIVRPNPRDEILKLKQEPGKNILLGGVDLASQIMALGLVDEYQILIQPTLAGAGRRLLEGVSLPESLKLKLVDSKIFESGNVALRYVKR